MRVSEFSAMMERIAPRSLALAYDNVGLLIGTERDIQTVLVALDCTVAVAEEAKRLGADLVLTHHPLFFHGIKRILPDDPETAAAYRLIRNGIGLFSTHTNLDACEGGVNDALAETLGLEKVIPMPEEMLGRIGYLPQKLKLSDFITLCNDRLHTESRWFGDPDRFVRKVGLCGGAGGDMASDAFRAGCDVYLTGEMKHHEAIEANYYGMPCVVAGHYETEVVVLKKWISRLQNEQNDVQYYETMQEQSPLITR